ncbi:ATP-binding protein [Rhizobacter sp. OV335]|uniref:ATP-binding protein n=1 Tax=Rhizobacter sp. OV335 TaxID=1500264 RepID=UPI0009122F1A|nr:ATP-binding protein [Rhizobacter sp. OV335]SHN11053.1 Signal transduction histidine kinase [Rhizobacter sp. OV335]
MKQARSLRTKLMAVVLLTTFVALTTALVAMVAYNLREYHRGSIADLRTQAELLASTIAPALAFDDPKVATENLALMRFRSQVRAAAVYDASGKLFASWADKPEGARFPVRPGSSGELVEGRDLLAWRPIVRGGELLGTVYLRADYALVERMIDYAGIALSVAALAMLLAWALTRRLQSIVTRPILAIASVAREVVLARDYSRRAQRISDDEVGTLVDSFNRMMDVVEQHAMEGQQALLKIELEVEHRREAQKEVMRFNEQLEQRVGERTAELEASNLELALATEAAEKANRAKSEFLSSMSHELRTPLNAVLGFGQLLEANSQALPDAKRVEFTQQILKAGRHLLNLINEILDLARIESANMMLSLEPVGLAEMLRECETMMEPSANQRGIRMSFPQQVSLSVIADRTRLKQVLLNLLSNAVKYNRDGGAVVVECGLAEPNWIWLSVTDTGRGLQPDQVAALFQPFNRLGQEASNVEGTGIGLVVTKRLVEMMGGQVEASSKPGSGSTFLIRLRAAEAVSPQSAPSDIAHPRAQAAALRTSAVPLLLHVEDNPANLQLVSEIVALRGDIEQISAPDAQLGIELARAHLPQIILMDINLPGLNGSDAFHVLSSDPRTAHIPVIAVTANAMAGDVARGLAGGFFRYITKPIAVDQLNEAIDSALAFVNHRSS